MKMLEKFQKFMYGRFNLYIHNISNNKFIYKK